MQKSPPKPTTFFLVSLFLESRNFLQMLSLCWKPILAAFKAMRLSEERQWRGARAAGPGAASSPLRERKQGCGIFLHPARKENTSSNQSSNHHVLSCEGSSSELPGKKCISLTSADATTCTRMSALSSAHVLSVTWVAPLKPSFTNVPATVLLFLVTEPSPCWS